ncbi:DNA phosphorothioation-dependent restriction protein DptH [Escherichia coli]|uniref:DNA phosphorothioation-dependent restriction protein DptH n=1 Tax=Escherichia coli TaxID=562 RepID=A0A376RQ72_ECOLX|nr:DNA phosphorothioation-dependent restriction protein DptH [Escherichia coli]
MLSESDICWVPLSVAEMIRVSGNVGLKMKESDLSRNLQGYRKGAISDDVLFVGLKKTVSIYCRWKSKPALDQITTMRASRLLSLNVIYSRIFWSRIHWHRNFIARSLFDRC